MSDNNKVGQYTLGPLLGTGNFSKVRRGKDAAGREWGIKIVSKRQVEKEDMLDQMMREIAIMRRLKHRNVLELREVLESKRHYFLVLELVTGGDLFDKIVRARSFNERQARFYFHQLIAGVYYCHANGCAHRDLKPENLLLDQNGTLKISDFGLCNMQQNILLQTMCGTPNYVAPEVLMERGYNGLSADIWSCGVILYVMLAGRLPFEHRNMNVLLAKIERGEYQMIRNISEGAQDLIRRMLTVNPLHRIPLHEVIQHRWFRVDWNPRMLTDQ